jgi:antitoxin MazE
VIEKPILELLNITRDTELEVTTDGTRLIIEPVRDVEAQGRRRRVGAATERVMKNHNRTLRRLAE